MFASGLRTSTGLMAAGYGMAQADVLNAQREAADDRRHAQAQINDLVAENDRLRQILMEALADHQRWQADYQAMVADRDRFLQHCREMVAYAEALQKEKLELRKYITKQSAELDRLTGYNDF